MSMRIRWERIESVLAATTNVIAAWAFGSAQNGQINLGSDIDIGVLFASLPTLDEQIDLLTNLQQTLQTDNIDLVVLNNANPILRFEAVSGRPVYCRDDGQRAEFVSLTAREYEDDMAFLQRAMAARR
jgi:predicted nucleotidyltransferase